MLPPTGSGLQPPRIELKAVDRDPKRSSSRCEALGAEPRGEKVQRDTYFEGPRGLLRVRQEEGGTAHLFANERIALAGQERLWRFDIAQPEVLLEAYAPLGIEAVVVKKRRLFLLDGVRIHLDNVAGLGCFIKLWTTAEELDPPTARARIQTLRNAFEIADEDEIDESYCRMSLKVKEQLRGPM